MPSYDRRPERSGTDVFLNSLAGWEPSQRGLLHAALYPDTPCPAALRPTPCAVCGYVRRPVFAAWETPAAWRLLQCLPCSQREYHQHEVKHLTNEDEDARQQRIRAHWGRSGIDTANTQTFGTYDTQYNSCARDAALDWSRSMRHWFSTQRPRTRWLWNEERGMTRVIEPAQDAVAAPGPLILHGTTTGVGKTHLATAICHEALLDERAVVMVGERLLWGRLRGAMDRRDGPATEAVLQGLLEGDVLVLDDCWRRELTAWQHEIWFRILDERGRRPLVITTNRSLTDMYDVLEAASLSRLNADATWVNVTGPDRRQHAQHR